MVSVALCNTAFSQVEAMMDTLLNSKVKELGIKEVLVWRRSKNMFEDTTYFVESKKYDSRGRMIENVSPYGRGVERRVYKYDSLDHKTGFFRYDRMDTTKLISEKYWIYIDSNEYDVELYHNDHKLYRKQKHVSKESTDTLWFFTESYEPDYNKTENKTTRVRTIGDTLTILEYIKYDDSLKLKDIDTYYHVYRKRKDGTKLYLEGQYLMADDYSRIFMNDRDKMIDVYRHPEKYLQMQLDGKFEFEYDDDPFTYRVYDEKDRLIQDGVGFMKSTFSYDDHDRIVEAVTWGQNDEERYGPLIQISVAHYFYRKDGLPEKITSENLKKETVSEIIYEYH